MPTSSIRSDFPSPARRATSRARTNEERARPSARPRRARRQQRSAGAAERIRHRQLGQPRRDEIVSGPVQGDRSGRPGRHRPNARGPGGRRCRRRALQPPQLRARRADAARHAALPAAVEGAGMVRADLRRRRAMAGGRRRAASERRPGAGRSFRRARHRRRDPPSRISGSAGAGPRGHRDGQAFLAVPRLDGCSRDSTISTPTSTSC